MSNISAIFSNPVGNILFPIFLLFVVCIFAIWFLNVSGTFVRFVKYKRLWKILYKMFRLSAFGTLTIILIGVPSLFIYYGFTYASETNIEWIEVGKTVLILSCLFLITVIIGYITNKRWSRYFENRAKYKEIRPK